MEPLPSPGAEAVAGPRDPAPPLAHHVAPGPRRSLGAAWCLGQWHSPLGLLASLPSSGRTALPTYRARLWRQRLTGAVAPRIRLRAASLQETAGVVCSSGSSSCLSLCLDALRLDGARLIA